MNVVGFSAHCSLDTGDVGRAPSVSDHTAELHMLQHVKYYALPAAPPSLTEEAKLGSGKVSIYCLAPCW